MDDLKRYLPDDWEDMTDWNEVISLFRKHLDNPKNQEEIDAKDDLDANVLNWELIDTFKEFLTKY